MHHFPWIGVSEPELAALAALAAGIAIHTLPSGTVQLTTRNTTALVPFDHARYTSTVPRDHGSITLCGWGW